MLCDILMAAVAMAGLATSIYLVACFIYTACFNREERAWLRRVELCELEMQLKVARTDRDAMAEAARRQYRKATS